MKDKEKITALIVAAGTGTRFGADMPKQFTPLCGQTILARSIKAFQAHPLVDDVLVVIHPDHAAQVPAGTRHVAGGADRQESVRLGLAALRDDAPNVVLIHDAARPLVSGRLIADICHAAKTGAAIPGMAVTDSVKRHGKTESRDGLVTVQTPQGFPFALIDGLHAQYAGRALGDDAALCEAADVPVTIVAGDHDNIKITHKQDMTLAERYLFSRLADIRTGHGYDVHRLIPASADRPLMICGIVIPHDMTLDGHSDADVGLHAITDAMLGALCDADIGHHFSPHDPRWKDADSAQFLAHAASLVQARGGLVAHVDVTLICEQPKIGPHRDAMRARVAAILDLPLTRVSVKATTSERLGFTGRGEGIAAQSTVTIRLPFEGEAA